MKRKVGVYICHCGSNIAGYLDVKKVVAYAATLPTVVIARDYTFMCSDPGQDLIKNDIKELGLNGVLVCSCSPTLHIRTFRAACAAAGLNPHLCEMATIRELSSWVHSHDRDAATEKAMALVAAGVRRVVYASSSSVYGDTDALPKQEAQAPAPASPYAVTKLAGELYCRTFYQLFGMETFSLRYFNVFGPRQDPNSEYAAVIPKFIERLLQEASPVIYGDGRQSRDFIYVADVVQANLRACHQDGIAGEVFNVASGRSVTLLELLAHLKKIVKSDQAAVFAPARPGDIRYSRADIRKALKLLGFQPEMGFRQGLKATVDYMKGNKA